ncbi:MAG TPA: ABC transporter substrate-binding protein [Acidimicrobiia bacterium]|jgi:branched-chain amino acid transport system substrate-binding protein
MNRFIRRLALPLCFTLIAGAGVACGKDKKSDNASKTNSSGAAAKEDIKVGAIFDLSGPTADIGTPYADGIKDYVEYRNSTGGVDGHKLALSWQDFKYDPTVAGQLYGQYVSEGAKVFMGWGTADTEALRPRVTTDKVPFMSASNAETLTDPTVTPYNFFPGASYSQQMRIILQYIADHNKGKVAVAFFHHDSPFGTSPLEDGKKYIADKKLSIDFSDYAMAKGATDYVAQIGQAKAKNSKYIIIQNVPSPAAVLATNLASAKSTAQIVCLNYCANEIYVKKAGAAAEKTIGVVPFAPPVAGLAGLDEINNFLKSKNTDAAAKGQGYVQGWYTMAVMSEGIKNALAAGGTLDGPAIKAGLEKIKDFKTGVSDPISFSSTFHAGLLSAPLYQVDTGQWKKIQDPITVQK